MDRIERELSGEAEVIRVNVLSPVGREAINRYGVRGLPTLVVLDGCGEVVALYAGIPRVSRVVESARAAPACVPADQGG